MSGPYNDHLEENYIDEEYSVKDIAFTLLQVLGAWIGIIITMILIKSYLL